MDEFDGVPDDGVTIDFGARHCCVCGGPKSYGAGKMCMACYRERAALRRADTLEGEIVRELLKGEREGIFVETPDGWTLPNRAKAIDWSKE